MKKGFLYLILLVITVACQQNNKSKLSQSEAIVKNIENKMLPDKRDHIFDINLQEKDGTMIINGATDYKELLDSITENLAKQNIKIQNEVKMLPLPEYKGIIGITRLSVANLRAQPKHSAELLTQSLMGMPLKIFRKENGFYQVQTTEAYYAWVDAAGIQIVSKQDYEAWTKKPKLIINSLYTTIYSKPNSLSLPVSDAVVNDIFILSGNEDDFYKVTYPDGRTGFIKTGDANIFEEFTSANRRYLTQDDIIAFAKSYLGIPYLWGGTSSKGLDCSGFTKNVYAQAGYLLPRDASQQAGIGKKLTINKNDFSNLQPGDLLFFGKLKNGKPKITHVAIHINKGTIIHATGEVKIESLNKKDSDYNEKRLQTLLLARRIYKEYPQKFGRY